MSYYSKGVYIMLHIAAFIYQHNRSARAIAAHKDSLARDWYTDNIVDAAQVLVDRGQSDWVYESQFASGTTVWCSATDILVTQHI